MKPIALKNAPHWLNHSHVLIKGRLTAGDQAEIANGIVEVEVVNGNPVVVTKAGNQGILKVQRMVVQGVVAVMLEEGETYEVELPGEAENLFPDDLDYICKQIDAKSKPLSAEDQQRFLASANGHSETPLDPASPSLKSL